MREFIGQRKLLFAAGVFIIGFIVSAIVTLTHKEVPSFPKADLTITLADGTVIPFHVEVATTPLQHEYGLMFRKNLGAHEGMIFIFDKEQPVSFWMKNTFIPLDMLFVRENGVIAKITPDAKPFDETPLSSGEPVHSVIELNAGAARENHVAVGDKVILP